MSFFTIAKALRPAESLLMTGFILIGAVFAMQQTTVVDWNMMLWVSIASYLLMLSVYSANSLLGYSADKNNKRLGALGVVGKPFYITATLVFYSISVAISYFLKPESLLLHLAIFLIWFFYALPGFGKHLPVIGTILHVMVAIAQFNFAYLFFYPISETSLLLSLYFALLISAGHLHHEIIDYEADKSNGINTSTVKWGIRNTKYFTFFIFASAHIYLGVLFLIDVIKLFQLLMFCTSFLLHLMFFILLRNKMENSTQHRLMYQTLYRVTYFLCGLIVSVEILFF